MELLSFALNISGVIVGVVALINSSILAVVLHRSAMLRKQVRSECAFNLRQTL